MDLRLEPLKADPVAVCIMKSRRSLSAAVKKLFFLLYVVVLAMLVLGTAFFTIFRDRFKRRHTILCISAIDSELSFGNTCAMSGLKAASLEPYQSNRIAERWRQGETKLGQ